MSLNYDYLISRASRHTNKIKLLDYGCGKGQIVELGLSKGIDAFGVDIFYDAGNRINYVKEKGLFGKRIFKIKNKIIPFPNQEFDVITSNMVFEHIDDFDAPLKEISRVLKKGGVFYNLFPTREVWREGHVGIPFVHWFKPNSTLRFYYTIIWRLFGFGTYKKGRTIKEWTKHKNTYIDNWTHYKSFKKVIVELSKYFDISTNEYDYMLFRLKCLRWIPKPIFKLLKLSIFKWILKFFCSRLGTRVFILTHKK